MVERMPLTLRSRSFAALSALALLIALLLAYSNHFHNSFHFDDAHTIETNAAIRELRNIPLFFRDATTFSSLPSNQSYRPLVSTLLAIDYRIGSGLNPFWFHASMFTSFVALTFLVAFVIQRLPDQSANSERNGWIAIAAAAWYGLHPANADTVNYIISASEVISTLGVIASFAVYMGFPSLRRYYVYVLPAAIAILAKPPAAIFAVLFAVYRLMFPPIDAGCSHRPEGGRTLRRSVAATSGLLDITPPFAVCAAMLLFVQHMTPRAWVAGATNAHNYLITQPYVALLYFKTFFWPSGLSADYDLDPFITTGDPRFWTGVAFVGALVIVSIVAARSNKTRVISFGLVWFLVALLPTSLFPLAEVMNDHRTFLPYIGLVIALAGLISLLLQVRVAQKRIIKVALPLAILLILCANGYATFERNKVWKTEETLWRDVVMKSPRNPRGLMNYGNTLMAKGDFAGALDYFHRAQSISPQYSVLLINLAIAEDATKQHTAAEQHFKDALRLAPTSPDSYTYYARYLLSHARLEEARAFLHSALELSPTDVTAGDLLTQAERQTANEPARQTPESYLALSLQLYREERYVEAIAACRTALELRPDYAEAWNNICAAYNKLGRYAEATAACEEALRYKPDFELARNNLQYARERASGVVK
jgi:tetratricopeptide (TPR) repeat protein